jgi:hypothetical protein
MSLEMSSALAAAPIMTTTCHCNIESSLTMKMHVGIVDHQEENTNLIKEWLRHTVIVAMHLLPWPSIYTCQSSKLYELVTEGKTI